MGVLGRVVAALFPPPNPRVELWAGLSESERIEDAGRALDRIDSHVRAYRRLLLSEAGFDPDEFPFDPHGLKPVHPIDARYQGGHRLVVEPIPVASVAAGGGAGAVSDSPTTPAPAPNTWTCAQCGKESAAAVSKSKPGMFCSAKCADAPSNATEPVELITEVLFRYVEEFGSIASIFRIRDVSQGIADRLKRSTQPMPLTFEDLTLAAGVIKAYLVFGPVDSDAERAQLADLADLLAATLPTP